MNPTKKIKLRQYLEIWKEAGIWNIPEMRALMCHYKVLSMRNLTG